MTLLADEIVALLKRSGTRSVRSRELARKLRRDPADGELLAALDALTTAGQIHSVGERAYTLRAPAGGGPLVGTFRARRGGGGMVTPRGAGAQRAGIIIAARDAKDAAHGDTVLVEVGGRPKRGREMPTGRVAQVLERADVRFIGRYEQLRRGAVVRVVGNSFRDPMPAVVKDGVKPGEGDMVVVEIVRYPSAKTAGQCEVVEALGKPGDPRVDALTVVRQFHLPDEFDGEALAEEAEVARRIAEQRVGPDRIDWTATTTVTIDPADAHDFDDAVSVERDEQGGWRLAVHIADVAHFVRADQAMDRAARLRGTSVYLAGHVLPMLPPVLSSDLASLIEGKVRFTKTVVVDFDAEGRIVAAAFQNSAIRVAQRLNYEEVAAYFDGKSSGAEWSDPVRTLLERMRALAALLRQRRRERGMLELSMPETVLEYDRRGRVVGAHYRLELESHRVIEEFMLTANEAVAEKLRALGVKFLRRIHPNPDPLKLENFAQFAASLDLPMSGALSRFELQRVLREAADKPVKRAVHYGFLRSMKEAAYSPTEDGHYALASDCYCHFTSPIRRYPDLVIHRMLDRWIRTGKAGLDPTELLVLGDHCSFTERRAAKAERELIKIKLLDWLERRVGDEMDGIVAGVEEYGLFVQGEEIPAEGLLSVRSLPDDFYELERATHTLRGRRIGNRFQLGQRLRVKIAAIDKMARTVDLAFVRKLKH